MTDAVLTKPIVEPKVDSTQKRWTYQDYLALPDDGRRYEIIEGTLYAANAPNAQHQFTVTEISSEMRNFVKANQLGIVLVAPFEVHLSEESRPVMPDVLFVRADRWPQTPIQFFEGAHDLVVEVISPSSIRLDRVVKFTSYEQAGVAEYWITNPRTKVVEVYTLSNGEYASLGEFSGDESIESKVLAGIQIIAKTLFQ
ncbi:MAG: Uma2 family endonuclease [Chloroflexota bacterium]